MKSFPAATPETLKPVIKRRHLPLEIMLTCVRWYLAYPLSLRHLEKLMAERGVTVDHATIHRRVIKLTPVLASSFRSRKRQVGGSWRIDETYIQINRKWHCLYRAVDTAGQTVDFYLSPNRDRQAARTFFEGAIDLHGVPKKINIDGSHANKAAVLEMGRKVGKPICLRQIKYLNNRIEQDHRAIKRIIKLMLGFKKFRTAQIILSGIETMHMIKKRQLTGDDSTATSAAEQFYSLAF
jgi:transposase-like protein